MSENTSLIGKVSDLKIVCAKDFLKKNFFKQRIEMNRNSVLRAKHKSKMRMVSVNSSVGGPSGTEAGLSLQSELHNPNPYLKGFPRS